MNLSLKMNSSLLNEKHRIFVKFLQVYCYAILKNRFVAIKQNKPYLETFMYSASKADSLLSEEIHRVS